jgi:hypothetical protein
VSDNRCVRIDEDLWEAAKTKAAGQGRTLTSVIEAALCIYTGQPQKEPPAFAGLNAAIAQPETAIAASAEWTYDPAMFDGRPQCIAPGCREPARRACRTCWDHAFQWEMSGD